MVISLAPPAPNDPAYRPNALAEELPLLATGSTDARPARRASIDAMTRLIKPGKAARPKSGKQTTQTALVTRDPVQKVSKGRQVARRVRKLIFLDVDGVLHAANFAPKAFRSDCMKALASLVQATEAEIILSSSWRTTATGRQAVETALGRHGVGSLSGVTGEAEYSRATQIKAWMTQNCSPKDDIRFIALDDMDMSMELDRHMVLTNAVKGLRMRDVLRGTAILNNEPVPEFSDSDSSSDSNSSENFSRCSSSAASYSSSARG